MELCRFFALSFLSRHLGETSETAGEEKGRLKGVEGLLYRRQKRRREWGKERKDNSNNLFGSWSSVRKYWLLVMSVFVCLFVCPYTYPHAYGTFKTIVHCSCWLTAQLNKVMKQSCQVSQHSFTSSLFLFHFFFPKFFFVGWQQRRFA